MTAMVWGVTGNVEKEIFYNRKARERLFSVVIQLATHYTKGDYL